MVKYLREINVKRHKYINKTQKCRYVNVNRGSICMYISVCFIVRIRHKRYINLEEVKCGINKYLDCSQLVKWRILLSQVIVCIQRSSL